MEKKQCEKISLLKQREDLPTITFLDRKQLADEKALLGEN